VPVQPVQPAPVVHNSQPVHTKPIPKGPKPPG
jgi:hypothetical protein